MNDVSRAADSLVIALEAQIRSGHLADRSPLPSERDLMIDFGVSRTVVREAILRLSGRGLVETLPRHRPRVRKPGYHTAFEALGGIVSHLLAQPGGIENLFQTRVMVEVMLARDAARMATKDDLKALDRALRANQDAINDSGAFYQTDVTFHGLLYQIPRNPMMPAIHKAYTTWLSPHWAQMPRVPARNAKNFEDHQSILKAILMRDADAAEDALRSHLGSAWKQVSQTFKVEDGVR